MGLDVSKLNSPFLERHLAYVDNTESPIIFHLWAALTCLGGCMGRHVYLETGIGTVFGNMYCLLVGPPATKKSAAIRFAATVMQNATDVRMAPDDTGGQRQGLISAILEEDELDSDLNIDAAVAMDIESLMHTDINLSFKEDKHVLFANASEFGSFMGETSLPLMRLLIKLWDGENYKYQLKQTKMVLHDPLLTLLGGTTSADISVLLPPEAIGQGFMSRFILVHAGEKEKQVSLDDAVLAVEHEPELQKIYQHVERNMRGAMVATQDARKLFRRIYAKELHIQDTRFMYYSERRELHLRKVAMILAASRKSMTVNLDDVETAERILIATELHMPEALGEFGLSPIAMARHKMLEYLRFVKEPVTENALWCLMQRDMKNIDFKNSLHTLVNLNKLTVFESKKGIQYMYKDEMAKLVSALGDDGIDALLLEEG